MELDVRKAIARKLNFNDVKGNKVEATPKQTTPVKMTNNYLMKTPNQKLNGNGQEVITVPIDIIDELVVKFLLNIPEVERENPLRACFQIELAHWFFVDYYCGENSSPIWKKRGHIPFADFAKLMFERCPSLIKQLPKIDSVIQQFHFYKSKVPVFGAILMNQELTKVVLVQGFSGTWGFPKGKINQDEDPAECAVREVLEETGYDCSHLLNREHFVEYAHQERWTRLYFVRGVDPSTAQLKPHTRFEIKNIGWFPITNLPESKTDSNVVIREGFPASSFFGVFPYVKRLRLWIDDKLSQRNGINAFKYLGVGRPAHILDKTSSSKNETTVSKTTGSTRQQNISGNNAASFPAAGVSTTITLHKKNLKENNTTATTNNNNKKTSDECPLTPNETFQKLFGFPLLNSNTTIPTTIPSKSSNDNVFSSSTQNNVPADNKNSSNIMNPTTNRTLSSSSSSNSSGSKNTENITKTGSSQNTNSKRQKCNTEEVMGRGDVKKDLKSPLIGLISLSKNTSGISIDPPDKRLSDSRRANPNNMETMKIPHSVSNIMSRTWLNFNFDAEKVLCAMSSST